MSEQHTVGPWKMGQTDHTYEEALVSATGHIVAYAAWDGGSSCYLKIPNEHDARLIAAAPELLEQLESAALALEEASKLLFAKGLQGTASIISAHCDLARDAIKKATQS